MPSKGQGGASLTVAQYSQLVLQKYLGRQFSGDALENREAAAEELYVLMARLRGAASRDSEDTKAPFKAIRNAIDHFVFHGARGADSPEVEALLALYGGLEESCERHMGAGREESEAAMQVQEALRYRLTRLVTGDAWDARPQLKMRVLKLMFRFMVRENEHILAGSRVPVGESQLRRMSRQSSFGKRSAPASVVPATVSRWGEAINEVARLPGPRVLPLLKLAMLENLELEAAAKALKADSSAAEGPGAGSRVEAAAALSKPTPSLSPAAPAPAQPSPPASESAGSTSGGTAPERSSSSVGAAPMLPPTPAQGGKLREGPHRPPPPPPQAPGTTQPTASSIDDLLGLFDAPPAQLQPATPAKLQTPLLPAVPASGGGAHTAQGFADFGSSGPFFAAAAASSVDSGNPFLSPGPWVPPAAAHSSGGVFQPTADAASNKRPGLSISGAPCSPGIPSSWQAAEPSPPPQHPAFAQGQAASSAPTQGNWASLQATLPGEGSSDELYRHNSYPHFDQTNEQGVSPRHTPSPYLGKPNPFHDTRFQDIAPKLEAMRIPDPAPPPAGPPMRTSSMK